jgi:hypothetical protein
MPLNQGFPRSQADADSRGSENHHNIVSFPGSISAGTTFIIDDDFFVRVSTFSPKGNAMETASPLPTLRPLRIGELLDRAIRLYRANFLTFVGIVALVYVPLTILQVFASALLSSSMVRTSPDQIFSNASYWIGMLSTILLAILQFVLVQGIAMGALSKAVADNNLGKKTGILEAYRGIGSSWASLLGALVLVSLLAIGILLWWIVPCIGWITGLGMLVYLGSVVNQLVPPVVVLEDQTATGSIRRAWSLARRRFWPVLGYAFLLGLFSLIVVNGPAAVVNIILTQVFRSVGNASTYLALTSIIQGLITLVFALLYYPLQMTAFTLVYFDLRVRTEGFDIALLTLQAEGTTDVSDAVAISAPETTERLLTWIDIGNFAILTLAGAGVYILLSSVLMGGIFFLSSLFD